MTAWAVEIIFYAALAIGVTWLSRNNPMGLVGASLILCSFVTNVAYFGASFDSRVTLELIQAVVVMKASRVAFKAHPAWPAAIVTGLAVIDTALCGSLLISHLTPEWRSFILGWGTNSIFFAQCLCVSRPGVRDAMVGRRNSIASRRGMGHAALSRHGGRGQDPS